MPTAPGTARLGFAEAGEPFLKLIDHPAITDVRGRRSLARTCAARAATALCATGLSAFEMHGGHRGGRVNFRYDVHNGQIYTGLTVVSIALQTSAKRTAGLPACPAATVGFSVP